jgi:hypothetical protein
MANLHVKLPDELYANLQTHAERNFRSVSAQVQFLIETWIKEEQREAEREALLQRIRRKALRDSKTKRATKPRKAIGIRGLEAFLGAMDLGRPTGTDNESIDADLARAYAGEG